MNSRERVLLAMDHCEADRIPIFAPNIIDTAQPYDSGLLRYLDAFPFDALANPGGLRGAPAAQVVQDDGTLLDGYGCRFRYMGMGLPYCVHSPLANAQSLAEIQAYPWPDASEPGLIATDARPKARALREAGEQLVAVGIAPLFHQYHYLRGFEQWMIDLALHRDLHQAIAERIHQTHTTLLLRLLDEVGEYVDMISLTDDLGTSRAPYMSPDDFRQLIKPYYADLIDRVRARWPQMRVYMHCHGGVMDLVPDLIECGVQVLNPILPLDNMDPVRLKREYGEALCYHGGIDVERILPFGSVAEVRDHVRRVIDILAPGGGYWFKAQAISPVIPPENIIAAYDTALEHGVYA